MNKPPDDHDLSDRDLFAKAFTEAVAYKEKAEGQNLYTELRNIEERYEKIRLLGEGAVKKVWLANDKLMDRQVALAQIKNDDQGLLNDFLSEARLASTLEHPYIAPVYDMGFTADKIPYFVMKLYEGKNLKEELDRRRKLDINANENITWILNIFLKVCEAVSFAHSRGVLHLDIKPSNIRINDYGEVLLCDWGIARLISSSGIGAPPSQVVNEEALMSRSTLVGEVRGTPGFMAPEQITKEIACNEQTDIYGLGALLHDMIVGEPPIKTNGEVTLNCPNAIIAIISKAISEECSKRYKNVQAFISDIEKFKSGMVTIAENASSWSIFVKWLKRHKKAAVVVLVNVVILFVLLAIYIQDINERNNKLAVIVNELNDEKILKDKVRKEAAEKYYNQSLELYRNAVSKFDFDERDIKQASEIIFRSLELNQNSAKSWWLSGILLALNDEYTRAVEDFSKAGPEFIKYFQVFDLFLKEVKNPNNTEGQLELIRRVNELKDLRLRNHLVFKNIHDRKNYDLMKFSMGAIVLVNKLETLNWNFDEETQTLSLGDNPVEIIYPLKTMQFSRLDLSNTHLRENELYNLRRIPLRYLNISYTQVKDLKRLFNKELVEINLEGCLVQDLSYLARCNVNKVNLYKSKAKLATLLKCKSLKEVICSEKQATELRKILPASVVLTVVAY